MRPRPCGDGSKSRNMLRACSGDMSRAPAFDAAPPGRSANPVSELRYTLGYRIVGDRLEGQGAIEGET